jgi:hypothetical protein
VGPPISGVDYLELTLPRQVRLALLVHDQQKLLAPTREPSGKVGPVQ